MNKTTLGHQQKKFFDFTQITPEDYNETERQAANIKQAKERLNLYEKLNHFVLNVHEQLQKGQTFPNTLKSKLSKARSKEKMQTKRPIQHNRKEKIITNSIECQNLNLARMKALCNDKHKKRMHKSTETTANCINYEHHKRIMLAQQRQHVLENMIKDHKLLIEDRRCLEQDIFAMRHSLDDLQHRVNNCLKELSTKKTYCECHGLM